VEVLDPPVPDDDAERVRSLRRLGLLDTPPEERFDRITRIAQRLFGVSMASVSLVDADRQWFKSKVGPLGTETPRRDAFCSHAVASGAALVVADAQADHRFQDNPLVLGDPRIRFYAGIPLTGPDGATLGTLCVMDDEPREVEVDDLASLRDLAVMVEHEIAVTELAIRDELTGLANRRGLLVLGRQVLEVCRREGLPASVVFADLDGLKAINDDHGHDAGDDAIRRAAAAFQGSFRAADVVARIGGDELVAVLIGTAQPQAAVARLQQELGRSGPEGERALGVSVGVASFDPSAPVDLEDLLVAADAAMYADKQARRR
jgi:diguanylate cyclase (GGDEF)-like protein